MATEEIEISQLELAEDLAPDMVLPVETTTDTKATTLQKIKEWLGSFFVHKTGDEKIGGVKTFTGRRIEQTFVSDSGGNGVKLLDSNNRGYVALYQYITNDGSHFARFLNNSYSKNTYLDIQTTTAGVSTINLMNANYAKAPIPSDTSNDNNIATTAWVNNKAIIERGLDYVKFGNGLIIQWGASSKGSSVAVTFPIAFSSATSFVVMVNNKSDNGGGFSPSAYGQTTTGFTLKTSGGATTHKNAWVAIGY